MPQLRLERGGPTGTAEPTTAPTTASGADIGNAPTVPYRRLKPGPGRSAAEVTSHQRARIDRAMVEVVVDRGYGRATVREIARVAGISTRAFYEHYSGKEECFLRAHRRSAQGLLRAVGALGETGSRDDRLPAVVDTIFEEWGNDRKVTRFLLVGPYGAGSAALNQLRLVDRSLGARLVRCLDHSAGKGGGPVGLIANGIAVGFTTTMRSMMLDDDEGPPGSELRQELTEWALSCSCSSSELEVLEAAEMSAEHESPANNAGDRAPSLVGDLALLHSAVVKLAASGEGDLLAPRHICAAAGVSRRSFDLQFSNIDHCLVAAASLKVDLAIERARLVSEPGATPESTAFRRLRALCSQVACDPALAYLCFGDTIESDEWLIRRDRLLTKHVAGLFESAGLISNSMKGLETKASLGAVLGLLRNEVAAGRAARIDRKAPVLGYLLLAPNVGKSSAMKAICEPQR